ncbi:hypothetical protein OKW30_006264 [Paraburkholderia sp. Clong3]
MGERGVARRGAVSDARFMKLTGLRAVARATAERVEPVRDQPGPLLRAAQLAFQIVEIAIADATQKAADRNTAGAGLLRDLIGGLEAEPVEIREHVAGDAFRRRREFGKTGFDGLGKSGRHRQSRRGALVVPICEMMTDRSTARAIRS